MWKYQSAQEALLCLLQTFPGPTMVKHKQLRKKTDKNFKTR